jgi:SAM-dependent methyltransferase
MENSIAANRQVWDRDYPWPRDGDEWSEFADYCGQPYERWYASVLDSLIWPFLRSGDTALEIAPGYGRWLGELSTRASHVVAVDLSPSCIDRCKERYSERDNVCYFVNDGKTLTGVDDASVNFAFSFEAFVHMEIDVIRSYLHELARVLVPGGTAVIHHAGRAAATKPLRRMRQGSWWQKNLYTMLSLRRTPERDGWRSDVSPQDVVRAARSAGLAVVAQTQCWGMGLAYDVRRFNDWISILTRPGGAGRRTDPDGSPRRPG